MDIPDYLKTTNHKLVDNFSDSEDEQEDGIVVPEEEELITIPKEDFDAAIAALSNELASLKTSTATEVQQIEAKRVEEKVLFDTERAHHAEELLRRQSRIDMLLDRMISK